MRRLMQTIIALPSIAASRSSKCATRSRAMIFTRFSEPTIASSCAHLVLSFSLRSTSSPSVSSSNSIDLGPLGGLQFQLGGPAFVIDRYCRAVDNRPLDVVDADIVAEDCARIGVGLLDRCPGKADKRSARQCVVQVPGKAVDEVVLAAMRLVGDDDDIAPLRQYRVAVALLLGHEFLD